MKLYGLLGFPLAHSFSQQYFRNKFESENILDVDYLNFELDSLKKLPELLNKNHKLHGFNVTIPYKEKILAYLDDIDPIAAKLAAVNTVKVIRTNNRCKLIGYNTDIIGFKESLLKFLLDKPQKSLILGTGGAAKAVAYVLKDIGMDIIFVSRRPTKMQITYTDLNNKVLQQCKLVVNTTPLGMYPNTDKAPEIPYEFLTHDHYVYDLVYNPLKTKFLTYSEKEGAKVKNGYEMLILQAEASWKIFNS